MFLESLIKQARVDFHVFVRLTMPGYIVAPHHRLMISLIQDYALRHSGRLYIAMPPRHGKSELCSVRLPAWFLGRFPQANVVHISYSADLSNTFSRQVRALVRDSLVFRRIFPNFALAHDRQRLSDWRTTAGGGFKSLGVGGGITGHGADLMIIDDPHKEGDADSLAVLDSIYNWYVTAARTRLSPGASIVFLMTRWHPLDLAGRVLETGEAWHQVVLPALAGPDDLLGREEGEALWPERYDRDDLLAIKTLDDKQFQSLFQNNPTGDADILFHPGDFKWLSVAPAAFEETWWSFDLATSESERADYSVMCRWGWQSGVLTLLHTERMRLSFPDVRAFIERLMIDYPNDLLLFPSDLLEMLMLSSLRMAHGSSRFRAVSMKGDKRQKALPFSVLVRNGGVQVVENQTNEDWVREVCQFPDGRFDDCVDAGSVVCHYIGMPRIVEVAYGNFRSLSSDVAGSA